MQLSFTNKSLDPEDDVCTIAYAGNMITLVTILFLLCVLFMFWVANLSGSRQDKPAKIEGATP